MAKKRKSDQAERAVIYMYCEKISQRLRTLGIEKTPDEICARVAKLCQCYAGWPVKLLPALREMHHRLRSHAHMDVVWGGPEWDIFRSDAGDV